MVYMPQYVKVGSAYSSPLDSKGLNVLFTQLSSIDNFCLYKNSYIWNHRTFVGMLSELHGGEKLNGKLFSVFQVLREIYIGFTIYRWKKGSSDNINLLKKVKLSL
jgi:hypothetical protein